MLRQKNLGYHCESLQIKGHWTLSLPRELFVLGKLFAAKRQKLSLTLCLSLNMNQP